MTCRALLGTLQALLRTSPTPLTRQEILARRPAAAPAPATLWRILVRGVEGGLFTVMGSGARSDPFRYAATGAGAQDSIVSSTVPILPGATTKSSDASTK